MLADHLWKTHGSFAIAKSLLHHILSTFFYCTPIIIILFRFCQTRWVEDCPIADRDLEVWPSVLKAIKYWEGLCKSSRPSITSCQVVVDHCTDKLIPCKLQFSFIASIFKPYLWIFQTDSPMLHLCMRNWKKIFTELLGLICN